MAQPPDISDTFVREVDENLRRDQARDFFKKNGKWLVLVVGLFLVASAGYIWWQQHQRAEREAQVEQLAGIYKDIGNGKLDKAPGQLNTLAKDGSKAVRASAMFTRAALAIQQNDTKTALSTYRTISEDSGMPQAYRDAALMRQTALEFDQLQPQAVIARLEPYAKPGEAWFGTAGEMTALALLKQGKTKDAGQLFAAIARDKTVPDSLRGRAIQIAATLGIDTSSIVPPTDAQ